MHFAMIFLSSLSAVDDLSLVDMNEEWDRLLDLALENFEDVVEDAFEFEEERETLGVLGLK